MITLAFKWKDSETEIVRAYNLSQAEQNAASDDDNVDKVVAGIVFDQEDHYTLRLGVDKSDFEAKTGEKYGPTLIGFPPAYPCYEGGKDIKRKSKIMEDLFGWMFNVGRKYGGVTWGTGPTTCAEFRYGYFSVLQSLMDNAKMWSVTGDNSLLPTSDEELCSTKMVSVNCQF